MELGLLTMALLARYDITLVDQKQVHLNLFQLISGPRIRLLDDKHTPQPRHCNSLTSTTSCIEANYRIPAMLP
jgi:hypothetical protein